MEPLTITMQLKLDTFTVNDTIIKQIMGLGEEQEPTFKVVLFNDDDHSMDEVVLQVQKATGYSLEKAETIMWEAHTRGQAVVWLSSLEECQRVAGVLEQIELRVSVEPV
jgi:ATP-dependent Clp protease adapter protein ClpS